MVKIVDIGKRDLEEKLKLDKISQLAKRIFKSPFDVDSFAGDLIVRDSKEYFLTILTNENAFKLSNRKYYTKTMNLAEGYEKEFKTEVILFTSYPLTKI